MDAALAHFREVLRFAPDDHISRPLWTFAPLTRKAVLSERRRRFGIEEERIDPTALTDEENFE